MRETLVHEPFAPVVIQLNARNSAIDGNFIYFLPLLC